MHQRVVPPANVERVAVGEERLAFQSLDAVRHFFGEVRTQKRQIPRFSKVDFNGHVFSFEVDLFNTSLKDQLVQFVQQTDSYFTAHVRKVNFRRIHLRIPPRS